MKYLEKKQFLDLIILSSHEELFVLDAILV